MRAELMRILLVSFGLRLHHRDGQVGRFHIQALCFCMFTAALFLLSARPYCALAGHLIL